jgi:hypothetical protein
MVVNLGQQIGQGHMKRVLILSATAIFLAACEPTVPDSGAGVGFNDYNALEQNRAERDAALAGSINDPEGRAISDETVETATDVATTTPAVKVDLNNPGISDEQDFGAVSSRESIESDRERLAAQSGAYQTIQPTALPTRSGNGGPSIVEFALSTSNSVGQSVYRRTGIASDSRFNRNCAKYASSDMAQIDFLGSGGPERDRRGIDPDGDGFACYWDPTPFRRAVNN